MSNRKDNIRRLAEWVSKNQNDSFSKFALALELIKNNNPKNALVLFESIRRRDPEYAGVYFHLGKLYQSMDRINDAEDCFREGIEVSRRQEKQQTHSELTEALEVLLEEKNHDTS